MSADLPARKPGKRTQLNRALSKLGLCSRGVGETWIARGRVKVNGVAIRSPEHWVELGHDHIEVDWPGAGGPSQGITGDMGAPMDGAPAPGQPASGPRVNTGPRRYFILHKPPGYVTTRSDELGRETVYDLFPPALKDAWLFPVGRLDKESEGLLLVTDDGEWADRLTDPAFHVDKVYRVKLDGRPREDQLAVFRSGMELDGSLTLPAGAVMEPGDWCRVTLREGRNRQIRRMFHALGYKVKRLVRVAIGPLELGALPAGEMRPLDPETAALLGGKGTIPPA